MTTAAKTLFFGDSITVGEGLLCPEKERWTALVTRARQKVEINEGKGGRPASALDEYRAALETHRSDPGINLLVVALGGNDARSSDPDIAAQVARYIGDMIDLARKAVPLWGIVICGPCNINRAHLQNQAIADLRERNLMTIDSALAEQATRKRYTYVRFLGVVPPASLTADGVHPGTAGHEALAKAFLAYDELRGR